MLAAPRPLTVAATEAPLRSAACPTTTSHPRAESAAGASDAAPSESRGRGRRRLGHWALVVLVAAVAGIAAVGVVSTRGDVGPGQVALGAHWATDAHTTIAIPPLGDVVFETHRPPLAIEVRIDAIDPTAAQRLATDEAAVDRFGDDAAKELRTLVVRWAWRALFVSIAAGMVAGALVWPRRVLPPVVGGLTAGVAVALLLAITWVGFSRTALRDPEYRGALEEAPAVLAAIDREWGGLQTVPDRLRALAGNITELYATVGADDVAVGTEAEDEVRILHISDIHSNPIGLELARGLATGFAVDAIVDTGDLTSFGLPIETRIGALLQDMPVPYYFVPGNHDTRANRAAVAAFPNVTLLDGEVADVGGVRILGVADPAVTADGEDSDAVANAKRDDQAPEVAALVDRLGPDVLAVATVRQSVDALGRVPLVVGGNSHRRSDRTVDGSRVLTVGSTGATGIGTLTEERDGRYEAQILRFRNGQLAIVDYVTFTGVGGDYTISRTVVRPTEPHDERPAVPTVPTTVA